MSLNLVYDGIPNGNTAINNTPNSVATLTTGLSDSVITGTPLSWIDVAGGYWQNVGGAFKGNGTGQSAGYAFCLRPPSEDNTEQAIQVFYPTTPTGPCNGILLRADQNGNAYLLNWDNGSNVYVYSVVGHNTTQIGSINVGSVVSGNNYALFAEASGINTTQISVTLKNLTAGTDSFNSNVVDGTTELQRPGSAGVDCWGRKRLYIVHKDTNIRAGLSQHKPKHSARHKRTHCVYIGRERRTLYSIGDSRYGE